MTNHRGRPTPRRAHPTRVRCAFRARSIAAALLVPSILLASAHRPATNGHVATAAASAPQASPGVLSLAQFGAACDGTTDDRAALQQAVDAAAGGVVEIPGACRIVATDATPSITLTGPITLRGTGEAASLNLDSDRPGSFRNLFTIAGDNVRLENLALQRVAEVPGIMLNLDALTNLSLDNVLLDGWNDRYPAGDFHGIAISGAPGERIENVSLDHVTIQYTDYGLLQDNATTSITSGFTVNNSRFTANAFDDLEFNAPNGTMTDIQVTNSDFSGNLAANDEAPAGFAVGLANVQRALIQGNSFRGYRYDPVHIEDRSADITVDNNTFADCFTAPLDYASHVFVINGSHDITITNNTFDTTANTNRIDAVYLGPGGGTTVDNILITGNTFHLGPTAAQIGNYGATRVAEHSNQINDHSASAAPPE